MNKGKKTKDMAECKEISPLANDSEELTPLLRGARLEPGWSLGEGEMAQRQCDLNAHRLNVAMNLRTGGLSYQCAAESLYSHTIKLV
jgi:hypothetical protein